MKTFADFQAFSQASRELAHWHQNYETVACYEGATLDTGKQALKALTVADYRVKKMKFAKTRDSETNKSLNETSHRHLQRPHYPPRHHREPGDYDDDR